MDDSLPTSVPTPVRVVTFDLDNTLWKTGPTIQAANDALHEHLSATGTLDQRVEHVMGELFRNDRARYGGGPSPVYLTQLRLDAIRQVLGEEHHDAADEAFAVWRDARYAAAVNEHAAPNVVATLERLRSNGLVVGAITDGNANPCHIPSLAHLFDFCVNAESVGVSKPDSKVYLKALETMRSHVDSLPDEAGPWWVHVGDDFTKDIVAAKGLNVRTIWSRELILDKLLLEEAQRREPERSVEELVKEIADQQVVRMQVGATDYLADALQREFADAIVDSLSHVADVIDEWRKEAMKGSDVNGSTTADDTAVSTTGAFLEVIQPTHSASTGSKFCVSCGTKLPAAAKFCSGCGQAQA